MHFLNTLTEYLLICYMLRLLPVCSVVLDPLQPNGLSPARLLCLWDSLGKDTGVGCHALLQGIFPTQGLNPGLLRCRQILYHLSHQGSPPWSFPTSTCKFFHFHLKNNLQSIAKAIIPVQDLIVSHLDYTTAIAAMIPSP